MLKILTPTDFSDISEYGLQVARDIALQIDAEIYLINYVEPPQQPSFTATGEIASKYDVEAEAFTIALTKRNSQRIHDLALKYQSDRVKIKPVIEVDSFKEAMNHFIKEKDIDLVVMGTSGETAFEEFFSGNHTEQVIRVSNCPVLSVKDYKGRFEPSSITLAIDLSTEGAEELQYFKKFAEWLKATVHFVHVGKKEGERAKAEEKMREEAERSGFPDYTVNFIYGKSKDDLIKRFAAEQGSDLIAVTTRARSGLVNLFMGSFSEEMVKEAKPPVLALTVNMEG